MMFRTNTRADIDSAEYAKASQRMWELVSAMPGFVSLKRCSTEDGEIFAMATFESEDALNAWRTNPEHRAMQRRGREEFYDSYSVRVCKVMREYEWRRETAV